MLVRPRRSSSQTGESSFARRPKVMRFDLRSVQSRQNVVCDMLRYNSTRRAETYKSSAGRRWRGPIMGRFGAHGQAAETTSSRHSRVCPIEAMPSSTGILESVVKRTARQRCEETFPCEPCLQPDIRPRDYVGGVCGNRGEAASISAMTRRESNPVFVSCTDERLALFSLWFQPLLQSFGPATHAKPSPLSAGNAPLELWAGLSAESRNRGTEEIGQFPQRLRAVDTPLAVDCGSSLIPNLARIPNFVPELSDTDDVSS
jgi:hypothetical protein